ncbi:hypothetical protein VTK73DRAFT_1432 [Phialemonium thermophilum]|uniref:J domain-containing protein n=1 Tax=Phialemonium thermophilum TaxID=223376 RepID=A0ABR3X9I8_9PEZI
MLFRYTPARAIFVARNDVLATSWNPRRRWLHESHVLRDDPEPRNHYETLNVHPDATPAEIKKSFYSLSKAHHPDHNPTDPHAGRRFMRISEAYAVLGHADKRARYDRDIMRRHSHHHHHAHRGSYHSSGPAGGRPASGLSRRRGTFTGPPPSFHRSGGWGAHGAKRRAAHDESIGARAGAAAGGGGTASSASTAGGMGPGQNPYGHTEDVPYFDREAHLRTHRRDDERRARRMAERGFPVGPETSVLTNFVFITTILLSGVLFPFIAFGGWRKSKDKAKG